MIDLENLSRETYIGLTNKAKLDILYDVSTSTVTQIREIQTRLEKLEQMLKRRLLFDRVCSGVGGVIGGFVFWLGVSLKNLFGTL